MASVTTGVTEDRTRDERGKFTPAVSLEAIEDYLREHRGASTGELADAFDVTTETIRRKCSTLEDRGRVRAREAGSGTFWQTAE